MKQWPKQIDWDKTERFIGSLKFAVIVISLFTLAMIAGTFIESYYGTDFANRVIYKSFTFMLIQFGMLLSIIFAALLRLPPKKRLIGFYIIHSGLVIIGAGSLITYVAGVDGTITLQPYEPNRVVVLSKDILKITYPDEGKQVTTFLPFNAFKTEINEKYKNITIKEYLPFAEEQFKWSEPTNKYLDEAPYQSSKYHFKNAFAAQDFILTNHPEASVEFQASGSMGPLTYTYYPERLASCFAKDNASKIIFFNTETAECFTPEERNVPIRVVANNRAVVLPYSGGFLTFFPDHSPFPIQKNLGPNSNSIIRVISKELYEKKPNLILFGKKAAFYVKAENVWKMHDMEVGGKAIVLPWMTAEISLTEHQTKLIPSNIPIATIPIQKDGALIKGGLRAVSLDINGQHFWASNFVPLSLNVQGKNILIEVTQESLTLPFEMALTQFKMDKNPGTDNPASYESFVKLYADGQSVNHHVYMNNPMKKSGFTFYQASYSEDNGQYSSTLAVNVDQGRTMKYLGSLMLVLGAVIHFNLNNKSKKNKNT